MTERDWLAVRICNATQKTNYACKDVKCIGIGTCAYCYVMAEDLLANGEIVPPCKVGQKVYYNENKSSQERNKTTFECLVNRFEFNFETGEHIAVLTVMVEGRFFKCIGVKFSDFGKKVFFTKEEANKEKAGS